MCAEYWSGNMSGKGQLRDPGAAVRILCTWILDRERVLGCEMHSFGSGQ